MNVKYLPSFMSKYQRLHGDNIHVPDCWNDADFKKTKLYSFCNFKLSVDIVKISDKSIDAIFEYVPMSISATVKKCVKSNGTEYENVLYDTQNAKKFYVNGDDTDELIDIITENKYKNIQIIISGRETLKKHACDILDNYSLLMNVDSLYIFFSGGTVDDRTNIMESIKAKITGLYLSQQNNSSKTSFSSSAIQSQSYLNAIDTGKKNTTERWSKRKLQQGINSISAYNEENTPALIQWDLTPQKTIDANEEKDIMETYWNKPLLTKKNGKVSTETGMNKNETCSNSIHYCQKKMWTPSNGFGLFYEHLNTGIWHNYSEQYLGQISENLCAASLLKPLSNNDAPEQYFKICFIIKNGDDTVFSFEKIDAQTGWASMDWSMLLDRLPSMLFMEYIGSYIANSCVKSILINGAKYKNTIVDFASENIKKSCGAFDDHKKITIYITKSGNNIELKVEHEIKKNVVTQPLYSMFFDDPPVVQTSISNSSWSSQSIYTPFSQNDSIVESKTNILDTYWDDPKQVGTDANNLYFCDIGQAEPKRCTNQILEKCRNTQDTYADFIKHINTPGMGHIKNAMYLHPMTRVWKLLSGNPAPANWIKFIFKIKGAPDIERIFSVTTDLYSITWQSFFKNNLPKQYMFILTNNNVFGRLKGNIGEQMINDQYTNLAQSLRKFITGTGDVVITAICNDDNVDIKKEKNPTEWTIDITQK